MKIGINILYVNQYVGFGVTTREILKELNKRKDNHQYCLFYNKLLSKNQRERFFNLNLNPKKFKLISIPSKFGTPGSLKNKMSWERFTIPRQVRKYKLDLFFSPYQTLSCIKTCPHIIMVMDMIYKTFPPPDLKRNYVSKLYYYLVEKAAQKADKIVTISEDSKNQIHKFLKINKKNIINISLGKNENLKPLNKEENGEAWKKLNKKFKGIQKPYFFFVANPEPRKNIPKILTAFSKLIHNENFSTFHFIFAGKKNFSQQETNANYTDIKKEGKNLGIEKKIHQVGIITEEEKSYFLNNASALIFPSLQEGFGLPVLEAMACGCPALTSNNSSLPEVAKDAALLVSPNNTEAIYKNMLKIVKDTDFRRSLIKKGVKRAQKFTWEKTADKLLQVIASLTK